MKLAPTTFPICNHLEPILSVAKIFGQCNYGDTVELVKLAAVVLSGCCTIIIPAIMRYWTYIVHFDEVQVSYDLEQVGIKCW